MPIGKGSSGKAEREIASWRNILAEPGTDEQTRQMAKAALRTPWPDMSGISSQRNRWARGGQLAAQQPDEPFVEVLQPLVLKHLAVLSQQGVGDVRADFFISNKVKKLRSDEIITWLETLVFSHSRFDA